jgi:2-dehydro-3-deoxyphosphogluconate aldolase / (4S)-4-hydroxy-2-oxoglutarate aldolase
MTAGTVDLADHNSVTAALRGRRAAVAESLARSPVVGVVRTGSLDEARRQAHAFLAGGLELVEITFTVPEATVLVVELLAERAEPGPPWIGMGTVTTSQRLAASLAAGSEFFVSPNSPPGLIRDAASSGCYVIAGALSPTEIVAAWEAGADLVKVYPLPPVGGPAYLATIRQPLGDIPMLAGGGFGIEEIPAYRRAGASAFGVGAPLVGVTAEETARRIRHALMLARGQEG